MNGNGLGWVFLFAVKVGIPEFLKGVGKGVESHLEKLELEIGDLHKLLVTRTLKLKKLGIPCKQIGFEKILRYEKAIVLFQGF
ncbi:hypothetical protein RHSIM_Rhsim05G0127900 [Rhododendron simsii]|uniref:Small ribosomal subunit protein mS41 SAM domain-containing protein n=1 Tax=Rhododendron simsii TaxID=118357 RepID=A0A834GY21_RHOSS|nr:hypothetical protein RHSIM_Rhsim05G0127900 [Rhododendron simsii]